MPRQPRPHFRLRQEDRVSKRKLTVTAQKALNESCLIYLEFIYRKQRLFYSFGHFINPANWDHKLERVKNKLTTTSDGNFYLNKLLDKLQEICEQGIIGVTPTPDALKSLMDAYINQHHYKGTEEEQAQRLAAELAKPTLYKLADRFVSGEIKFKGKDKSKSSLQNYAAVLKHLKAFEQEQKYPIDFETINLDFFYKYVDYLKKRKLAVNTIAKDISILKVFMNEAVDLDYTDNLKFRHKKFSFEEEPTEQIYLNEKELNQLYKFDLSHNRRLEQVRDLFIFGAWVGLRISDYNRIKPENIKQSLISKEDYFIDITTQKTKDRVIIPCNPVVMGIFKKYDHKANKLPNTISDQNFNKYIKEACRLAGLDTKGRLHSKPDIMLWEKVTSHTCRRSFATNYYLQNFPVLDLMKITTHKTERSFLKYIRLSPQDAANRLMEHNKKNWSAIMLQVA